MRSVILVIITAVGLAGLFVAYWTMQPLNSIVKPGASGAEQMRRVAARGPHMDVFHPGDQIWLKQYDDNGQLSSKFRGTEYLPQPDGTVLVMNPVAQFFLANHQRIDVRGTDGNVIVKDRPDLAHNAFANPGPLSPPSRGKLNNVTVTLVDEAQPDPQLAKLLVMTTNNVVFDNESFRIATEGYRDSRGQVITDDQVPVHVTGQLVMEGRGLVVRWNDKDGRLELLEIAHGEWLRVDHPSKFSLFGGPKRTPSPEQAVLRPADPLPEMLASNDKNAAGPIITSHPQSRQRRARVERSPHAPKAPAVYRASFYDHVRITQQDPTGSFEQVNITDVKQMDLDFLLKEQSEEPATRPTKTQGPAETAPSPTTQPSESAPLVQPQTQLAAEQESPAYVFWTGVLRITPLKSSPPAPLAPGDAAVTLVGAPVSIHRIEPKRQGTEDIRCASVLYETAGEKARLDRSTEFPQILVTKTPAQSEKDQRLTRLTSTGSVLYSRGDGRVVMSGPGQAEVPLEAQKKDEHPLLQAAWTRLAQFDFTRPSGDHDAQQQPVVQHGYLEGDVDVKHPELALRSHALELFFDPPAQRPEESLDDFGEADRDRSTQPRLRQAVATTKVWCRTIDKDGKPQTIECDRLALNTALAQGKLYARKINATGAVHARSQEDDLRAQYVDLLLAPSKKSQLGERKKKIEEDSDTAQVELERMVARDGVIATSKEGSVAQGGELVVTAEDGKQHMVLTGNALAKVTDVKGNVVTGPRIEFDSDDGRARVIGAGTLHAIQQPSATQPATPIDVAWVDRADFNGPENRIDVTGRVHATSVRGQNLDEAIGERIHLDLRPKPPRPSTQPIVASATSPKAKKDRGGMKTDLFGDKDIVAMTVEQDARLLSTLTRADGTIEQQVQLKGPTIIVRELAADGSPSRSVIVPTAGRMGISDHRRQPKQPLTAGADEGGARGDTAFQWTDLKPGAGSPPARLVYSEADHRADITGDVLVVHQDEDKKQPPVRLNAQRVTAFFEPTSKRQSATGTRRQNASSDESSQMQLRSLRAIGPMVVVRRDADQMTAREVDYDPRRHLLIATGAGRNSVVFDSAGAAQVLADRIVWDTITWDPKFTNGIFESQPAANGVQSQKPAAAKPKLPAKGDRRSFP